MYEQWGSFLCKSLFLHPIFKSKQFFTNPFYWLLKIASSRLFPGERATLLRPESEARLMYGLSSSQEVIRCPIFSPKASGIPSV